MLEGLTSFGPEGGDAAGGEDTAPEAQVQQPEAREPHSRTRTHDEQGRFAGPAPHPPEAKEKKEPAAPPPPQRLKFKVPKDDGSGEEELELTPEEASQRMAEARKLLKARDEERAARQKAEKEAKAFRRLTEGLKDKQNRATLFRQFVRESGLSPAQAEDFLAEALHGEIVDANLTPEQRRIRELEAEKEAREEEERQTKADAELKQFEEKVRTKEQEYGKLWSEAMKKTGLPPSPGLLADIAKHHLVNKKGGYSLTADELASYAVDEFDRGLSLRLKDVPAEEFAKRFPDAAKAWDARTDAMAPEDFLKKHPTLGRALLKHFREKARGRTQPGVGAPRPAPRAPPVQKQNQDDEMPRFYSPWDSGR